MAIKKILASLFGEQTLTSVKVYSTSHKLYRYECNVGESSFETPQGIFHDVDDLVWPWSNYYLTSIKRFILLSYSNHNAGLIVMGIKKN